MARTPDEKRRADLLARAVDYVCEHGVSQLSLRPLGQAIDCSPRLLLYFFSSKEELVTEVLAAAGERQRVLFARLQLEHLASPREVCRAIWRVMSTPEAEPIFRLFFEVYGLALQDRKRYARFLDRVVAEWLAYIGDPLVRAGWKPDDARAYATVVIAGFRGFMLDLCATRDRARIDRALDLWLDLLNHASPQEHAS